MLGRNSDAGVRDFESDGGFVKQRISVGPKSNAAGFGELPGVGEQISKDLPETLRITVHGGRCVVILLDGEG